MFWNQQGREWLEQRAKERGAMRRQGQVTRAQQHTARTSAFTLGTMEPPQGVKRRGDRTTFPAKGPRRLVESRLQKQGDKGQNKNLRATWLNNGVTHNKML